VNADAGEAVTDPLSTCSQSHLDEDDASYIAAKVNFTADVLGERASTWLYAYDGRLYHRTLRIETSLLGSKMI
jgi:hypothetical protein